MNHHITKLYKQALEKVVSISPQETQIKTMRQHFAPTWVVQIKKTRTHNADTR